MSFDWNEEGGAVAADDQLRAEARELLRVSPFWLTAGGLGPGHHVQIVLSGLFYPDGAGGEEEAKVLAIEFLEAVVRAIGNAGDQIRAS